MHASVLPVTVAELLPCVLVGAWSAVRTQSNVTCGPARHRLSSAVAAGERVCIGVIARHDILVLRVSGRNASRAVADRAYAHFNCCVHESPYLASAYRSHCDQSLLKLFASDGRLSASAEYNRDRTLIDVEPSLLSISKSFAIDWVSPVVFHDSLIRSVQIIRRHARQALPIRFVLLETVPPVAPVSPQGTAYTPQMRADGYADPQ